MPGTILKITRRSDWFVTVTSFILLLGCGTESKSHQSSSPPPVALANVDGIPLVNGDDWVVVEPDEDPFRGLSPGLEECRGRSHQEEYGGVEIDTSDCKHITLSQPISDEISRGDRLRLVGWHSQLYDPSTQSALGHMALSIGSNTIWGIERQIPGPPTSWDTTVTAPVDVEPGTLVFLHVRNHGGNSWNLYSLTRIAP